uniref:Conserved oligomeric Golgi complex subunit 6 n=1 Tax=Globodera pallida TaxID=36090 RepID=A0A183C3C9_GLOPA
MSSLEGKGGLDALLASRLDEDESFVVTLNYLSDNLHLGAGTAEPQLRMALEDRELELNQQYLEQIEKMNDRVQSFVLKIRAMNAICCELTERIQSNKEKTRELLKKTAVLQTEKRELGAKKVFLDEFFGKYLLDEEEERALALSNQHGLPTLEILNLLGEKLRNTYANLYASVQRECRLLNVEFLDIKPALVHSFELLHRAEEGELFSKALDDYGNARRGFVVRAFIDTLTRGAKIVGSHGPIEQLSTDPLRYVNEMLSWVQHTVAVEKEMLAALLRDCMRHGGAENVPSQARAVLASVAEALCQPLRLRVEQCITKEGNCVVLNRLATLLLFYADAFKETLSDDAHMVLCCKDLHELCTNMCFSAVSSSVQRILVTARVPDYDLLPVQSVNQALLLLRDILEAQNDGAFAAVQDKRSLYNKAN